mmetsp:Transcript_112313/g.318425  ORF Transcript_112313/g.318425 Transcript_112313/m.318425 type:complete len:283 (+) Transcript_112313:245-1093(+)
MIHFGQEAKLITCAPCSRLVLSGGSKHTDTHFSFAAARRFASGQRLHPHLGGPIPHRQPTNLALRAQEMHGAVPLQRRWLAALSSRTRRRRGPARDPGAAIVRRVGLLRGGLLGLVLHRLGALVAPAPGARHAAALRGPAGRAVLRVRALEVRRRRQGLRCGLRRRGRDAGRAHAGALRGQALGVGLGCRRRRLRDRAVQLLVGWCRCHCLRGLREEHLRPVDSAAPVAQVFLQLLWLRGRAAVTSGGEEPREAAEARHLFQQAREPKYCGEQQALLTLSVN